MKTFRGDTPNVTHTKIKVKLKYPQHTKSKGNCALFRINYNAMEIQQSVLTGITIILCNS